MGRANRCYCALTGVTGLAVKATMMLSLKMHRAGQRCFELLALIGSPQDVKLVGDVESVNNDELFGCLFN